MGWFQMREDTAPGLGKGLRELYFMQENYEAVGMWLRIGIGISFVEVCVSGVSGCRDEHHLGKVLTA